MAIECPNVGLSYHHTVWEDQYLTADTILAEIERVLQSNEDFVLDEGLKLEITHVHMPNGGAGKTLQIRK